MSKLLKHKNILTEKSTLLRDDSKIVISCGLHVTKKDISSFVKNKYDVNIKKVNSLILKGKKRIKRNKIVQFKDIKKFYITVDDIKNLEKVDS